MSYPGGGLPPQLSPPPGLPPSGGYGPAFRAGPAQGYWVAPVEHPQGTIVLILGIVGLVVCQLASPVAWLMGNRALSEIDANPGAYSNRSAVNAGRICGIIGTVILIVSILFAVAWVVLFILLAAGSSSTS